MSPPTEIDEDAKKINELFAALTKLESDGEFRAFFEDLCTPAEIRSMADRWQVARLLKQNMPYRTISERTGVSTATITRVARSMTYGAKGYHILLQRLGDASND